MKFSSMELIVGALAVVAVLFLIFSYNNRKATSALYVPNRSNIASSAYPVGNAQGESPASLLPKDVNKQWGQMNPGGNGQFANVALLDPKQIIGINTIGSTLRNPNLQERSEPPNPQNVVGPWNQSTIEPDTMRAPLEIGCGKQ
jgi:hypothetical protein